MSAATTEAEIIEPKIEKAALLDDEGDLTAKVSSACTMLTPCMLPGSLADRVLILFSSQFESALIRAFARFSSSYRKRRPDVHASGSSPSKSLHALTQLTS